MNDVTRTSKENYILGEKQRNVLMSAADALEHGNNLAILAMMVRDIANGKQPAHEPLSAPDDMDESGRNGHFQNYGYVGTASGFIVRDGTFWVATFRTGAEADQYVDLRNEEQPASALPTFVCPVCKADPCQTVWHDQACDYAPTDDGIAHVGGKGCIPKITRPSPPPGAWLPIETAPKDGTVVLLFRRVDPWNVIGYGRWEGGDPRTVFVSGWVTGYFNDPPGNLGLAAPTHWMPLPASPETKCEGRSDG
jgi:hypothetical protein